MTSGTPSPSDKYIGSKINLISRAEIRYEGILYQVDTNESTVTLAKVRSFGTESRPSSKHIPPRSEVYEFIIFRASDIKDLNVTEMPAEEPNSPAILSAQSAPISPSTITPAPGGSSHPQPSHPPHHSVPPGAPPYFPTPPPGIFTSFGLPYLPPPIMMGAGGLHPVPQGMPPAPQPHPQNLATTQGAHPTSVVPPHVSVIGAPPAQSHTPPRSIPNTITPSPGLMATPTYAPAGIEAQPQDSTPVVSLASCQHSNIKMAKGALEKLEEQLNCPICLDTYTDPKLLQCFHVYCRQCLVPLVDKDQQRLTCPTCRQVTPIPDRGVAGLQPAFHINHLLEVQQSLQKVENPAATPVVGDPGTAKHLPRKVVRSCFEHPEEELRLHCETCGELVCVQCIMKGGKHHDHDCAVLEKAFEKYKEDMTSSLEPMEKQVKTIEKALAQLDTCCREISDQRAVTEGNIHVTFRRLREVLNVRETELIGRLHELTQEKLKDLAAQRDQIETTLAQLHSCLHYMRESLRPGNEGDVMMMKTNTVKQVKELTTPFQPDFLEPNTKADIEFSVPAEITPALQNYGKVFSPDSPVPSERPITDNGNTLFLHRCKLFTFDSGRKCWKECGLGNIKIMMNRKSGKVNVIMRREQGQTICCNHYITSDMKLLPGPAAGKSWIWCTPCNYFNEESIAREEKLAVKFKQAEIANQFKDVFNHYVHT